MPFYTAQMTLKMVSGVTADVAVNSLHFVGSDVPNDPGEIEGGMFSFYDDLVLFYSASVAQNGHTLKVYNLDDPQPRYPALESTYNFPSAPTGNTLPHEVAIVASFQADRISGTPQARRRNRIYIGPLKDSTVSTSGFVQTANINALNQAMEDLESFMRTSTAVRWIAYSPTEDNGDFVTNGWVDNAFDTQRRRGRKATVRTVWP